MEQVNENYESYVFKQEDIDLSPVFHDQNNGVQQQFLQPHQQVQQQQIQQQQQEQTATPQLTALRARVNENFVWRDELIHYFINQWESEPCLYDVNDDDYHLKEKRYLALERIRDNMSAREFNPLPSITQMVDKMNSLRTYFNSQTNKKKASVLAGAVGNKIYKIRWQFYDSLMFLLNGANQKESTPRDITSRDTIARETNTNFFEDDDASITSPVAKKSRRQDDGRKVPGDSLIEEATLALRNVTQSTQCSQKEPIKTDDMHFGETIGRLLGGIDDGERKDFLKLELQRLILMTKYSQYNPSHHDFPIKTPSPAFTAQSSTLTNDSLPNSIPRYPALPLQ